MCVRVCVYLCTRIQFIEWILIMGEGLWQFITMLKRKTHEEGRLQVQTFFKIEILCNFLCITLTKRDENFHFGFNSKGFNSLSNQQYQEETSIMF